MLRWDATAATVILHRVLQEILRTRQTEPTAWLAGTLQLLDAARPNGEAADVRTWRDWEPLRPHVAFTTLEGERLSIADPTSELMGALGTFLSGKALHAAAEQLKRSALTIDERTDGPNSPQVALRLNNLARSPHDLNRSSEAEPLMRRALAIDEQSYGTEHPRVAVRLNNLAQLLKDTNRLVEAEPMMRRALAIDEQSYGGGHPDVAIDLNNLAKLLQATNRLAEAEPMMRRALDIFRSSLGDEHPSTLTVSFNYALLRAAMTAGDPPKE